jgi:hypothetical protein
MDVSILNQEGERLVHRHMPTGPEPFLKTIAPYRESLVVCVAGIFPWDWLTCAPGKTFRLSSGMRYI